MKSQLPEGAEPPQRADKPHAGPPLRPLSPTSVCSLAGEQGRGRIHMHFRRNSPRRLGAGIRGIFKLHGSARIEMFGGTKAIKAARGIREGNATIAHYRKHDFAAPGRPGGRLGGPARRRSSITEIKRCRAQFVATRRVGFQRYLRSQIS